MTMDTGKKKMGRPRKLGAEQVRLGVRVDALDLAIVDARSAGEKKRSDALRDILRRYDGLIAAATPRLPESAWRLALSALRGSLDEATLDDAMPGRVHETSAISIRTALRYEVEDAVASEEVEQAWAVYTAQSDVALLAMGDVAQRFWALSEEGRTLERVLDWRHVSDWAAPGEPDGPPLPIGTFGGPMPRSAKGCNRPWGLLADALYGNDTVPKVVDRWLMHGVWKRLLATGGDCLVTVTEPTPADTGAPILGQLLHYRLDNNRPTVVEWERADGGTAGALVLRLNRRDAHLVVPVDVEPGADGRVIVGPAMAVVTRVGAITPVSLQFGGVENTLLVPDFDNEDVATDPVDLVALGLPGLGFNGQAHPVSSEGGCLALQWGGVPPSLDRRLRELIEALA